MADIPGYFSDTELYYETEGPAETVRLTQLAVEIIYLGGGSSGGRPTDTSTAGPCAKPVEDPERGGTWTRMCDFGGQAPDTTPVTNSENWAV